MTGSWYLGLLGAKTRSEVWFGAAGLVDHERVRVGVDVEDLAAGQRWSTDDEYNATHRDVSDQDRHREQKTGAARRVRRRVEIPLTVATAFGRGKRAATAREPSSSRMRHESLRETYVPSVSRRHSRVLARRSSIAAAQPRSQRNQIRTPTPNDDESECAKPASHRGG